VDKVIVFAPASIGNAGPCYDIMGYALDYVGDFVTLEKERQANTAIIWDGVEGPYASELENVDYRQNTAWLVADHIWMKLVDRTSVKFSLHLKLHKYMPVGSGIGSSAASCVATAAAMFTMLDIRADEDTIIECLEVGEKASSGVGHLDNVIPSYFGGFYLICEGGEQKSASPCKRRYIRIGGGNGLVSVVVRPEIAVTTEVSRQAVSDYIKKTYLNSPSVDATHVLSLLREESSKAAGMVHAVTKSNPQLVGEFFNKNYMLEAARSKFIPRFDEVKAAARKARAYGCTIAGSGPAVVAITDDQAKANRIRDAMVVAFNGLSPKWLISPIGEQGARVVSSIEDFVIRSIRHHNFFGLPERSR